VFEHHSEAFYHHYKFTHQSDANCHLGCLEFVLVELPKFKAETPIEKEIMGLWLQFMNETGKNEAQIPDLKLQNNPDILEAMTQMQESAFNVAEKDSYDQYLDKWRTHRTMLSDAEQKGKAEGKAEGKLEVAKAMKAKGLDDATIIELIGLSAADLSKI
jgi:predicted transposase/invertase (TIGR01784 family)